MKNNKSVISKMTLEEKASLLSGKNFWYLKNIEYLGVPSIMVTDGPHGLRKQIGEADHVGLNESVPATCFPTASALAATWNRDLIYQVGVALGEECRQEKVGVILGPGANIKRSPLCGRNFEYFSEDPYLSGEMAKSHINGIQSQGIGTSLKHYVANNQEYRRMTIDTIVDERALREIYLAGYEIAVKGAQPWTVMCAYNKINGIYASDHKYLLTDILREEWGHEGIVVTDWGALNDPVEALKGGLELEMPGTENGNRARLIAAVEVGDLDENMLDQAVDRILTMIFKASKTLAEDFRYDTDAHHALARRVASEGAVLLKNESQLLPLQKNAKVALIGRFAKEPRYQGAGSSLMNPTRLDNIHDEMVKVLGKENVFYAAGYSSKGDKPDENLISEALGVAEQADVVLVCAGLTDLYETEGIDRFHMRMPLGHDALITKLATAHEKVIVILSNGSPVEMPWSENVQSILESYLGGQAGGSAAVDILFGEVNPSGKLAETFPVNLEDNPSHAHFPGGPVSVEYRESIFVGYRYYDTVGQPVLFPFGHGLSYTSFAYRNLKLEQTKGKSISINLTFTVQNTGKVAGKETVQVYVRDIESTAFRPLKELKGFEKISLEPGEEVKVTIELDHRAFAFYDVDQRDWVVETGEFEILIGASSQDIRLSHSIQIDSGQKASVFDRDKLAAYYNFPKGGVVPLTSFEALLGRSVASNDLASKGNFTINTPVGDMTDTLIGKQLFKFMNKQIREMIKGMEDTPTAVLMESMVREMPLRGMLMSGNEAINRNMLEALLVMINGKFFKGLMQLLKAKRGN